MSSASVPRKFEWLPAVLAAVAFVGFAAVFVYELFSYQQKAVEWAMGDVNSRAHLAAANLAEPLRTQDFAAIQRAGAACEADGVHLVVTTSRGGIVFSSQTRGTNDLPIFSDRCPCGEYEVMVGMPRERVLAPFKRAIRGFLLAGLVGVAGVLLFFFVTYRQRVRIRELAKLEKFRREFIADVSHEIKTPLTGILGAVDLLEDSCASLTSLSTGEAIAKRPLGSCEDAASPLLGRLLPLLKKEAKRLNGLVQSILDLARLEREGDVLGLEEVDLADLVHDTVDGLMPTAKTAGVALVCQHPRGETPRVRCDAQLVSQAVLNLVINAIRHSGSKDIVVSLEKVSKFVRIVVEDHGVGIPPEHAAQVFERFHRVDPARAAETGGAGLGLAIVRQIARLHGGEVTLTPAKPQGCRFAFSIAM